MTEAVLRPLLEALVTGLEAEPRVAVNVCWAFNSLAEAAYDAAEAAAQEGNNGFDGMGQGTGHSGLEQLLDFWREPGMPLVQDGYLGSI